MVSLFQIEYGRNEQGTTDLVRVPVRYGDASRQAQTIIQQNSRNSLPSTPLMTFYITGLDYDRPRMQDPSYVNRVAVRQRTYDVNTDTYETTQGNAFTIERLMPVPYKLTINLDIWTSNTNQKMQLFEQIATLFNPSLEIQSTDNYLDWTSLSTVDLEKVNWSSRTIPMDTNDAIDIMTMTFSIPIWISSPAKVKKLGVVERIVASIYDAKGDAANAILDNDLLMGTRQLFTPYGYQVVLINNILQVLRQQQVVDAPNDSLALPDLVYTSNLLWTGVIGVYGAFRPGISQVRLDQPDGSQVVGTIVLQPNDDRFAIFTVDEDTIPQNTIGPIDAVIDPLVSGPGDGLDSSLLGQRYLFTEATGNVINVGPAVAWQGTNGHQLVANANDIVEYDGVEWIVVFESASSQNTIQYVTNITTGTQYQWTGNSWVKSYQGLYPGGEWSLVL